MLVFASAVFAYYTVWTLLMVCKAPSQSTTLSADMIRLALRRRTSLPPDPLPSPRLGHSHSGDSYTSGQCGGGQLLEHSHGAEQPKESGKGCEGAAAEGAVSADSRDRLQSQLSLQPRAIWPDSGTFPV